MTTPTIHTTPSGGLLDARAALAKARAAYDATKSATGAAFDEFTQANAVLFAREKAEKVAVENADAVVRTLALKDFERLGVKRLVAGVEIAITKKFAVDEAAGLAWAKAHGMLVLPESLDIAGAKKMATVTPLPFVTITETPSVKIASDLSAVVGAGA